MRKLLYKKEEYIKIRKSFGLFLCFLLFAVTIADGIFATRDIFAAAAGAEQTQVNEYGFADGDGSEQKPFLITTPSQLDNMRKYLSKDNPDYNKGYAPVPSAGLTELPDLPDDDEDLPPIEDDEDLPPIEDDEDLPPIEDDEDLPPIDDDEEDLPPIDDYGDEIPQFLPYYFALGADIDLGGALENGGELYGDGNGWQPVGGGLPPVDDDGEELWTLSYYFYGVLDGRGHSIRNLWMNRPDAEYAGLFGAAFGIKVKDLRLILDGRGITGKTNAGGIAGYIEYYEEYDSSFGINTIKNCSVTGKIKTAGQEQEKYAGGFVGAAMVLAIDNSYFEGTLSGADHIGGLAGSVNKAVAKNCYVKARASGALIGGVFGYAANWGTSNDVVSNNQISECFIDLTSDTRADAFAAEVFHKFDVTFSYYAARERITADSAKYYTNSVAALDMEQQKSKKAYYGFDFSIWGFDKDGNLVLRIFAEAYDPPVPPDLTWLYITLPCLLFAAAVIITAIMLYRRKKTQIITETVVETQTVEVIKEVPIIKKPLPEDLSEQEIRTASLILKGKSLREISDELNVSKGAVSSYASRIYIKAGVNGQKEFLTYYFGNDDEKYRLK